MPEFKMMATFKVTDQVFALVKNFQKVVYFIVLKAKLYDKAEEDGAPKQNKKKSILDPQKAQIIGIEICFGCC